MQDSYFDQFWQASSLDKYSLAQFGAQLNAYDSDGKSLRLDYPDLPVALPDAKGSLKKYEVNRRSGRNFSGDSLSLKDLSLVLSGVRAWRGLEHRSYGAAGAAYTVEIFCVPFHVDGYDSILYYDAESHGVVPLPLQAPTWIEAQPQINVSVSGEPQCLMLLVVFPGRATAKYGERGGRFSLMEAGAALQQMSINLASDKKLRGVATGGLVDDYWLDALGLVETDARIAVGYLVGR